MLVDLACSHFSSAYPLTCHLPAPASRRPRRIPAVQADPGRPAAPGRILAVQADPGRPIRPSGPAGHTPSPLATTSDPHRCVSLGVRVRRRGRSCRGGCGSWREPAVAGRVVPVMCLMRSGPAARRRCATCPSRLLASCAADVTAPVTVGLYPRDKGGKGPWRRDRRCRRPGCGGNEPAGAGVTCGHGAGPGGS
jgi:hypothetical protein